MVRPGVPVSQALVSSSSVFSRVVVEPAYKAVSAAIERAILDGALPPGAALPTEQELSERFGVHRSTVREAIRQVEQEGLLQRREGRRLFVVLPGVQDLAPRATRALLLQRTTFRELWDLSLMLEPPAARLAAAQRDAADLASLQDNLAATAASNDDPALVQLDVEFHALVGRATHNHALMLAREPISLLYQPTLSAIFARLPQARARNLDAHRRIVDAIERGDADAAASWTHKHMVDFQRGFTLAGLDMAAPIVLPHQPPPTPQGDSA
jgi:DNA-binding FadR family transcriptional regulator